MKYNIYINQKAAWETLGDQVDLVDLALLDYLRDICAAPSPKLERRLFDGEEYVWVSYNHIKDEMPLLGLKDRRSVVNRINKLVGLELIKKITVPPQPGTKENRKSFIRLTRKAYSLFFDTASENIIDTSSTEGVSLENDTVSFTDDTGVVEKRQIINTNDHNHQDNTRDTKSISNTKVNREDRDNLPQLTSQEGDLPGDIPMYDKELLTYTQAIVDFYNGQVPLHENLVQRVTRPAKIKTLNANRYEAVRAWYDAGLTVEEVCQRLTALIERYNGKQIKGLNYFKEAVLNYRDDKLRKEVKNGERGSYADPSREYLKRKYEFLGGRVSKSVASPAQG